MYKLSGQKVTDPHWRHQRMKLELRFITHSNEINMEQKCLVQKSRSISAFPIFIALKGEQKVAMQNLSLNETGVHELD